MFELAIFLLAILLMLFLGAVVFVYDPKKVANKLFFLWVIFASVWMATNFLENLSSLSLGVREVMLRIDFASSVVGCSFLLLFVLAFTGYKLTFLKYYCCFFSGLIMAAMSFSPYLLHEVFISSSGAIAYTPGPIYEVYGLVILGDVIIAAIILGLAAHKSEGTTKSQMRIILFSFLVTLLIAIPINFFLQNTLPYQAVRLGIYSFLIFVGGTAYTIVKYEFLRVRFILIEIFLLGLFAMLLSRLILSVSPTDFIINVISIITLAVLGFFLVRSVVREIAQRSELEALAKKLQAANEKLKQLDAAKTEFLSIASHQLRTPLSAIRGYVDLIADGSYGKITRKQAEVIGKVHGSVETLIELVSQLLNVSRIESGKTNVAAEKVDLTQMCTEVTGFLSVKAQERGLSLSCSNIKPVAVWADAAKVKEVLMNLIENSLKYTDQGGVQVSFLEEPRFVRVNIKDSGIGLDSASINRLFQKFSRVESAAANHAGTGLGLYVCKRLIEAMGGEIWVESPGLGKGSTFSFRLKKVGSNNNKKTRL
jgi:signal transduction histidine kinase